MSILDDAIREHLELKRAHGADEAEVKKLEDEAFGPAGRPEEPDPFAEAPTEFLTQPEAPAPTESAEQGDRGINIADLQEPPQPQADAPMVPAEDPVQAAPPAEEEPPAIEHEVVPAAEPEPEPAAEPIAEADSGHNTEERHAIAEQPTEFFDIEAEMGTEDAPAPPAEAPSPSDEQLLEAEAAEPLAPVEPPTEIHASRPEAPVFADEEEEDDDFWSEQRLSDELDQALEAPVAEPPATEEHEAPAPPPAPEPSPQSPQLFDQVEGGEAAEAEETRPDYDPDTGHDDVLEDTPEFLEDAPEDDELWFEQRPPKDFDFDD
ncbi:MAG TPA: hypothetical protein VD761_05880 [Solirubrobacterales bacterium]|nr:hypothetical protein [Solirubrobacterales bacterium]